MTLTKTIELPDKLEVGGWGDLNDCVDEGIYIFGGDRDSKTARRVLQICAGDFEYNRLGFGADIAHHEDVRAKMFAFAERLVNAYNTLNSDGERKDG